MQIDTQRPLIVGTRSTPDDYAAAVIQPMPAHLHPVMAAALAMALEEEWRIRADILLNEMKNSGDLHRRESERAMKEQVKWEAAQ